MGILGWLNERAARQKADGGGRGWQRVGVYFYRADGRYPPATWAETPQEFVRMIPDIQKHIERKLEVRITNGDDHLLFHATDKGIEWDGINLTGILNDAKERQVSSKEKPAARKRDYGHDR